MGSCRTLFSAILLTASICIQFETASALAQSGVIAHRGASKDFPENTLAALEAAVQMGAHGVEFDVRVTRDGELVLMHDASVHRTTNGRGLVSDLNLGEIKKLDAGSWKNSRFEGEQVPTFAEALAVLPRTIWINIHVKDPKAVMKIANVISTLQLHEQALIACRGEDIALVHKLDPRLKTINMSRKRSDPIYIDETVMLGADAVQFLKLGKPAEAKDIQRAVGLGLMTFHVGVEEPKKLAALFSHGLNFVLADDTARALDVYHNR